MTIKHVIYHNLNNMQTTSVLDLKPCLFLFYTSKLISIIIRHTLIFIMYKVILISTIFHIYILDIPFKT